MYLLYVHDVVSPYHAKITEINCQNHFSWFTKTAAGSKEGPCVQAHRRQMSPDLGGKFLALACGVYYAPDHAAGQLDV